MDDCTFCKIVNKTLAADIVTETDNVVVLNDIMPRAPIHLVIISKKHIPSVNDLTKEDAPLIAEMVLMAQSQAREKGLADRGYQIIWHVGKEGSQTIPHLHLQVRGGKQMPD